MSHAFYSSKVVKKTRKPHSCEHCRLAIPTGSECQYDAGKFDGDFYARYSHSECAKQWVDINHCARHGEEWIPLSEMGDVYPHESFAFWKEKIISIYKLGEAMTKQEMGGE